MSEPVGLSEARNNCDLAYQSCLNAVTEYEKLAFRIKMSMQDGTIDNTALSPANLKKLVEAVRAEKLSPSYAFSVSIDSVDCKLLTDTLLQMSWFKRYLRLDLLVLEDIPSPVTAEFVNFGCKEIDRPYSISLAMEKVVGAENFFPLQIGDILSLEFNSLSDSGFELRLSVREKATNWMSVPLCTPTYNTYLGFQCATTSGRLPFACFRGPNAIVKYLDDSAEHPECPICYMNEPHVALKPCRHAMCESCAQVMKAAENRSCPFCRGKVVGNEHVYRTSSHCAFPDCGCDITDIFCVPCGCLVGCTDGLQSYSNDYCPVCYTIYSGFKQIIYL